MAEIPVEKKSGLPWWVWLLLLLLLVGLIWWLIAGTNDDEEVDVVNTTPVIEETVDPAAAPTVAAMTVPAILANPQAYIGQTYTAERASVGEVATDRGFWITENGERMLAIVIDEPREERVDINQGQTLRITGGTLRDATATPDIPGEPLDADTQALLAEQPIFLLVDEKNIEIL